MRGVKKMTNKRITGTFERNDSLRRYDRIFMGYRGKYKNDAIIGRKGKRANYVINDPGVSEEYLINYHTYGRMLYELLHCHECSPT